MRDLRLRLGIILALALLPLLLLSMWRSYTQYQSGEALLRNNTDLTARIALTEIVSSFETTQSILRFTSTLLAEKGCEADLGRLTREYPRFYNLVQADGQGKILCEAKPIRSTTTYAQTLISKLSPESPFVNDILTLAARSESPDTVIVTAYGVFNGETLAGVYVAVEDINFLLGLLQKSKILEDSQIAILNPKGEVIQGSWTYKDIQKTVQNLPLGKLDGKLSTEDTNGNPLLILPTPAKNIYLAVATQRQDMVSWNKFNPIVFALIPLLAWIFGFAAIWLSTDQLILTHLRRMKRATMQFARGDRSVRVGDLENPPHSIAALGKNFDIMADNIVEREAIIKDSLDEKETLLREIHHRVKNNLQIIISLLNMQERQIIDKEGLKAIFDTRSRINAIALVHRGLYESVDLRYVDMQKFLDRLLPELTFALGFGARNITVSTIANCEAMEADTATPVALFIVEAVTNSVKHGVSNGGEIDVLIQQTGEKIHVSVADNGNHPGHNLKPNSAGIGTKLMKGFARQLNGTLSKKQNEDGYKLILSFIPRSL